MGYLILARHGESEWNKLDLWTGWTDISLNDTGRGQARASALLISEIPLDIVFVSKLKRARETWEEMASVLHKESLPITENEALNERDYGNFAGMNKFKIQKEYGDALFQKWRRGWDYPVPHGETLKDVYARVVPYYVGTILPQLKEGKNVAIVAHGNSLRALIKYLEHISDEEIVRLEVPYSDPYIYKIDQEGKIVSKEIRTSR